METPLSGSKDVILNRISNLDQAAASAGKLLLISEDHLKILASLAKKVFQMCEELYKVEIDSCVTSAQVCGPSTQEMIESVHNRALKPSAAVTQEEIVLPSTAHDQRLGDELKLSTIQSEHSFPVLEESVEYKPRTSTDHHNVEGNILTDPGGSGDTNDVAQTQPEMRDVASAIKVENGVSIEDVNQPEVMESASTKKESDKSPESRILQVKIEYCSDTDPADDIGVNNVAHTEPDIMESSSAVKDEDISVESSEWQITDVRTELDPGTDPCDADSTSVSHTQPELMESSSAMIIEDVSSDGSKQLISEVETGQNSDTGYYIGSAQTSMDVKLSDRKNAPTSSSAPQHMKTHTGERPYKCEMCDKNFSYKGHLLAHIRRHTGEETYKCEDCGRSFNKSGHLFRHMRTHTGEKPYKCQDCDKTFSRQFTLCLHMRTHTGEKPYECPDCGKTFSCQQNAKRHRRSHTGERPYKCPECDKTFCRHSSLCVHMRTHTGLS